MANNSTILSYIKALEHQYRDTWTKDVRPDYTKGLLVALHYVKQQVLNERDELISLPPVPPSTDYPDWFQKMLDALHE